VILLEVMITLTVKDVLDLVLPEVATVLALLDPFVEPIIKFLETAVANVKGANGLTPELTSTATEIQTILKSVVLPIRKSA
jgi:hypothetical protein